MYKAKQAYNMPIVSELMSEKKLDEFEEYVDPNSSWCTQYAKF